MALLIMTGGATLLADVPFDVRHILDWSEEATAEPKPSFVGLGPAIVGVASVTDGDTLDIRKTRIRLHGIDAPESGQACDDARGKPYRCGQQAANALAGKIGRRSITCEPRDKDRYGRIVAVCRLGSLDLNAWLVEQGWAIAFRRYSLDYVWQEAEAKKVRRGIWAGGFVEPEEWRKGRR